MVYYANGGFNWHDLYYMPTKLREFYWRELIRAKEEESEAYKKSSPKTGSSRIKRR